MQILNLCPTTVDIFIAQGDLEPWTFTVRDAQWKPIDITGMNFEMHIFAEPHTMGTHAHGATPPATPQMLTGTVTNAAGGVVEFAMTTLAASSEVGSYFYEVIATLGVNSRVLFNGNVTFVEDMCGMLPATDVEICNMALSFIGETAQVQSINPPDQSSQAVICSRFYPIALKATLEMHRWAFATNTVALVECHPSDKSAWDYCYILPDNFLKAICVLPSEHANDYQEAQEFSVEQDESGLPRVYTDQEDAVLKYTMYVSFTRMFPPLFQTALAWHLASMIAGPIIKGEVGANESKRCLQMMMMYLGKASVADSEVRNIKPAANTSWIAGR